MANFTRSLSNRVMLLLPAKRQLIDTSRRLRRAQQRHKKTKMRLEWSEGQTESLRRELDEANRELDEANRELESRRQQLKRMRQHLRRVAREVVLQKMPEHSVCAEIGVDEGEFSRQILETVSPEKLHLIDPWRHEEGDRYQNSKYGGLGSDGQAIMEGRYEKVKERLAAEIRADQVEIHRELSSTASRGFEDSYFDWLYIDGNHLYECVKQDLELYCPKVKDGGYIVGDDYGAEGWWENGVQRAVDKFTSQRPYLTLEVRGTQFVIRKGGAAR